MGNYMEDLGWMDHEDYGLGSMGEEEICHVRYTFVFDFLNIELFSS